MVWVAAWPLCSAISRNRCKARRFCSGTGILPVCFGRCARTETHGRDARATTLVAALTGDWSVKQPSILHVTQWIELNGKKNVRRRPAGGNLKKTPSRCHLQTSSRFAKISFGRKRTQRTQRRGISSLRSLRSFAAIVLVAALPRCSAISRNRCKARRFCSGTGILPVCFGRCARTETHGRDARATTLVAALTGDWSVKQLSTIHFARDPVD
jgi:hypothetical protein